LLLHKQLGSDLSNSQQRKPQLVTWKDHLREEELCRSFNKIWFSQNGNTASGDVTWDEEKHCRERLQSFGRAGRTTLRDNQMSHDVTFKIAAFFRLVRLKSVAGEVIW